MKTNEVKTSTENNQMQAKQANHSRPAVTATGTGYGYAVGQQIQLLQSGRLAPVQMQEVMLNLQRTIGNRAVVQLMSKQQQQKAPQTAPSSPSAVEANQAAAASAEPAEKIDKPETDEQTTDIESIDYYFPFDFDGDGNKEQKRLYFKRVGSTLELIINPDPVPFEDFIGAQHSLRGDPALQKLIDQLNQELFKLDTNTGNLTTTRKGISHTRGAVVRGLLLNIAGRINALDADEIRPRTEVKHQTKTIHYGAINEIVNNGLTANPLTAVPPAVAFWTGYEPRISKTPLMAELNKVGAYVRGHMLNSQLHGPGEDDNLVPISSKTNSDMKVSFENDLKYRINGENQVLRYEILPSANDLAGNGPPIDLLPDGFAIAYQQYTYSGANDRTDISNWKLTGPKIKIPIKHIPSKVPRRNNSWAKAVEKEIGPGCYYVDNAPLGAPQLEADGRISSSGGTKSSPAATRWRLERLALYTLGRSANAHFETSQNTYLKSKNGNPIVEEIRGAKFSIMPTPLEITAAVNHQKKHGLPYTSGLENTIWANYSKKSPIYEKVADLAVRHGVKVIDPPGLFESTVNIEQETQKGTALAVQAYELYNKLLEQHKLYAVALDKVTNAATPADVEKTLEELAEAQENLSDASLIFGRKVGLASEATEHVDKWIRQTAEFVKKYEALSPPLVIQPQQPDVSAGDLPQPPAAGTAEATDNASIDIIGSSDLPGLDETNLLTGMSSSSGMSSKDLSSGKPSLDQSHGITVDDDPFRGSIVPVIDFGGLDDLLLGVGVRVSEQNIAQHEGISDHFIVGHAHGDRNACLISSLINHAKGTGPEAEPSAVEVEEVRLALVTKGVIQHNEMIDIVSSSGGTVIEYIESRYGANLKVIGLLNGRADVETPIKDGAKEAIIYAAPGHFIPVWRRPALPSAALSSSLLPLPVSDSAALGEPTITPPPVGQSGQVGTLGGSSTTSSSPSNLTGFLNQGITPTHFGTFSTLPVGITGFSAKSKPLEESLESKGQESEGSKKRSFIDTESDTTVSKRNKRFKIRGGLWKLLLGRSSEPSSNTVLEFLQSPGASDQLASKLHMLRKFKSYNDIVHDFKNELTSIFDQAAIQEMEVFDISAAEWQRFFHY